MQQPKHDHRVVKITTFLTLIPFCSPTLCSDIEEMLVLRRDEGAKFSLWFVFSGAGNKNELSKR